MAAPFPANQIPGVLRMCDGCLGEVGTTMAPPVTLTDRDDVENLRVQTVKDEHHLRVVIHGECDFSMVHQLDRSLPRVEDDPVPLIQLDLSELTFADTATIRALASFARYARRTGHDVHTFGVHPTMARVTALLHVRDDLGLSEGSAP
ncbi:STAS domain-containing protein [Fodinibacter luteus]